MTIGEWARRSILAHPSVRPYVAESKVPHVRECSMGHAESESVLEQKYSRRTFIKGIIATGATVSSANYLFRGPSLLGATPYQSATERLITLTVNGQARPVDVLHHETLAMTLRYKLGLTGTKLGCDRAECGACTVLVDGVNQYSCSILTHQLRGRSVTTIEGLEDPDTGELSVVQQAVMDEGGFQCAFCAPGFIMSMEALIEENPNPTREEAAQALSGNLCRCADYHKILNCAMRAAELARSA
jgi:aerobic-type carbon monoxide dehydrogenase small subunit (CoxS/CutS family)